MLRSQGLTYREFETAGLFLVVADISCRYVAAAEYDDLLLLRTRVEKVGAAHVCHAYELHRGSMLIATGTSTVVCVDREGRVRRLPAWMPGQP
jgi:acyl-CoA thioester hydrolase